MVGPQPAQALLHRDADIGGTCAAGLVPEGGPELRRDDDPVAPGAERLAKELLALAGAIAVGSVEEVDARVGGSADDGVGRRGVDPPTEVVAADPDHGHVQFADPSRLHRSPR